MKFKLLIFTLIFGLIWVNLPAQIGNNTYAPEASYQVQDLDTVSFDFEKQSQIKYTIQTNESGNPVLLAQATEFADQDEVYNDEATVRPARDVVPDPEPGTIDYTDPNAIFDLIDWLYSLLVIVGGYLSSKIPVLNNIQNTTYRVLSFAILTGIGFISFGAPILSIALGYFMSTSLYEIVLKWFFKTRKPA